MESEPEEAVESPQNRHSPAIARPGWAYPDSAALGSVREGEPEVRRGRRTSPRRGSGKDGEPENRSGWEKTNMPSGEMAIGKASLRALGSRQGRKIHWTS